MMNEIELAETIFHVLGRQIKIGDALSKDTWQGDQHFFARKKEGKLRVDAVQALDPDQIYPIDKLCERAEVLMTQMAAVLDGQILQKEYYISVQYFNRNLFYVSDTVEFLSYVTKGKKLGPITTAVFPLKEEERAFVDHRQVAALSTCKLSGHYYIGHYHAPTELSWYNCKTADTLAVFRIVDKVIDMDAREQLWWILKLQEHLIENGPYRQILLYYWDRFRGEVRRPFPFNVQD